MALFNISGKKNILGIEFANDFMKIALMKKSQERLEAVFMESIHIKNMSQDMITDTLSSVIKTLPSKNYETCVVLPVNAAITKTIQIPSIDNNEIKDILNLQAGRQTPYSREELILDYLNLGTFQNVYTKVLSIMVKCDVVKKQFDILRGSQLKPLKMCFASEAVGIMFSYMIKLGEDSTRAILNIDTENSEFSVFNQLGVLFTRNIPLGVTHILQDGEPAIIRFINEVRESMEAYQAEDIGSNPTLLLIAKNGGLDAGVENGLANNLNIEIKKLDLESRISIKAPYAKVLKDEKAPSFVSLLSCLWVLDKLKINLIPQDIKLQRKFEAKGRKMITLGVLFMVIFFQVCIMFITTMIGKEKQLDELKQKFKEKINEANALRNLSGKTSQVKHYLLNRLDAIEVLSMLYNVLPDEMYLKGINIDAKGKVFIKGTSKSMSRIFAFVTELENNNLFKEVKTEFTESRKEAGQDVSDFGIVMSIEK